jgi:hypothetical protein
MRARTLALLGLVVACSQGPTSNSGDLPLATVTSDSGRLTAAVFSAPVVRGVNTLKLHITDGANRAQDGLAFSVTPWMVSHAHGASVIPIVTPMGSGDYVVSEVDLFMPGRWQIRVSVTAPMTDTLTPALDVP